MSDQAPEFNPDDYAPDVAPEPQRPFLFVAPDPTPAEIASAEKGVDPEIAAIVAGLDIPDLPDLPPAPVFDETDFEEPVQVDEVNQVEDVVEVDEEVQVDVQGSVQDLAEGDDLRIRFEPPSDLERTVPGGIFSAPGEAVAPPNGVVPGVPEPRPEPVIETSFADGLKAALREEPEALIVVSEPVADVVTTPEVAHARVPALAPRPVGKRRGYAQPLTAGEITQALPTDGTTPIYDSLAIEFGFPLYQA